GVARSAFRRPRRHEPALGADGHDDGILRLLGLHQTEDFGAEILRPVRPANAAARNLAETQVHGLEPRRIDEHLIERPGHRHLLHLAAFEFGGDRRFRAAFGIDLIEIRPYRRADRAREPAQDAIFIEAFDAL